MQHPDVNWNDIMNNGIYSGTKFITKLQKETNKNGNFCLCPEIVKYIKKNSLFCSSTINVVTLLLFLFVRLIVSDMQQ